VQQFAVPDEPQVAARPAQFGPAHSPSLHTGVLPPHAWQGPPPVPQCRLDGVSQVVPLQHPAAQLEAVHAHAPLALHAWPLAHAPHCAPPVPHWLTVWLA